MLALMLAVKTSALQLRLQKNGCSPIDFSQTNAVLVTFAPGSQPPFAALQ